MVKAIWAVACPLFLIVFFAMSMGCGAAKTNTKTPSAFHSNRAITETELKLREPGYRIGPEDLLRISVWNNPELSLDLTVRPDGKISVPLIQDVQAEGLTPGELSDSIHTELLKYIKDPQVSVIVLQVNAPKYYILGAVKNPGTYPLRGDLSLLQAISIAGGFTPFASLKNIRLVRNNGGNQVVRVVNYYKVIENRSRWNYLLRPGDTIVVPE